MGKNVSMSEITGFLSKHRKKLLLLILISIIAILLYLYKTSEVINKKVLGWILVIVIFVFILAHIQLWLKNRAPELKFRLALIALQNESNLADMDWMGDALWTGVARQLQVSVDDQAPDHLKI